MKNSPGDLHGTKVLRTNADGLAAMSMPALLVLEVSRTEIESGLYSSALERLLVLTDSQSHALRYQEALFLQVVGYDDDHRELPEIPEVRAFFADLTQTWPHWMWFLSREFGTLHLLVSLLTPVTVHRKAEQGFGVEFTDTKDLMRLLDDLLSRDAAMFEGLSISKTDAQESAAGALYAILGQ